MTKRYEDFNRPVNEAKKSVIPKSPATEKLLKRIDSLEERFAKIIDDFEFYYFEFEKARASPVPEDPAVVKHLRESDKVFKEMNKVHKKFQKLQRLWY